MTGEQSGQSQDMNMVQLQELQGREMQSRLRANDLQSRLQQLQAQHGPKESATLVKEIDAVQHQVNAASLEADALQTQIQVLLQREINKTGVVQNSVRDPIFGRKELQSVGLGGFFLMIPIVLALARRIWVRSAPRTAPGIDLESSPRLERLEQAIESIAVEVERIGEGQRFATKLLAERPDAIVNRPVAIPRREPGVVTPH